MKTCILCDMEYGELPAQEVEYSGDPVRLILKIFVKEDKGPQRIAPLCPHCMVDVMEKATERVNEELDQWETQGV